jgi:hypothetical protein
VKLGRGEDSRGLGRVVRAGISKTSAPVVSGDGSCDDVGVAIWSWSRKEVVATVGGVVVWGTTNIPVWSSGDCGKDARGMFTNSPAGGRGAVRSAWSNWVLGNWGSCIPDCWKSWSRHPDMKVIICVVIIWCWSICCLCASCCCRIPSRITCCAS